MLLRIDTASDEALFLQVAASIRADAAAGRVRPGDRLPAAREVADALGINVHTVLHAYQELRDEGLLDIRRGRGAVVTSAADNLASLRDEVAVLVRSAQAKGVSPDVLAAIVKEFSSDA
ncbi:GntR family transcriptional regulator [Microbacterium terrae]|uniref:HTH-type transcriptional repressor YtrA n=1 Tax=Microbacterium terrae TaxID=69369 RepID=A0A0M2H794_9MICO|nr:GntR family transcriptional regulator [Microbacterium terrae]KJL39948.1 HTH-type transcriptional repressor YtrA [Microbacterium terrae]MBP1076886.1 GntR family transcriptional regulator [Microbacterium terrae]GLJ99481.1 GntR family transcriptional regulator [Microbacterium terrae]